MNNKPANETGVDPLHVMSARLYSNSYPQYAHVIRNYASKNVQYDEEVHSILYSIARTHYPLGSPERLACYQSLYLLCLKGNRIKFIFGMKNAILKLLEIEAEEAHKIRKNNMKNNISFRAILNDLREYFHDK